MKKIIFARTNADVKFLLEIDENGKIDFGISKWQSIKKFAESFFKKFSENKGSSLHENLDVIYELLGDNSIVKILKTKEELIKEIIIKSQEITPEISELALNQNRI